MTKESVAIVREESPDTASDTPDRHRPLKLVTSESTLATPDTSRSSFLSIFTQCKKIVVALLLSCFLLSIPSSVDHSPQPIFIGPFPIPPMKPRTDLFPLPEKLRPQVDFWKKIFTEYTTNHVLIHDDWYVNVVYEIIDISDKKFQSKKKGWKAVRTAKEKYATLLESLPWENPEEMKGEQQRVYSLFKDISENPRFRKADAKDRIHLQQGNADSFRSAIIRSGRYMGAMKQTFRKEDAPWELVCLPLIESSFDPSAISYVGASGIWQFMKGTGRHYDLLINDHLDERNDPFLSTRAAARFLKDNYKMLGSWPLAITAYNHGPGGIRKAMRQVSSENIADIIWQYDGPLFKFASRNFYAEFLAALEVYTGHAAYFGAIELEKPLLTDTISLSDYVKAETLEQYLQLTPSAIKSLNPAFRDSVFSSENFLPKDYPLTVLKEDKEALALKYESVPAELKYEYRPSKLRHLIRKGETLSEIAKANKTSLKTLMRLNNIRKARRIRPGKWLRLPGEYVSVAGETVEASPKREDSKVQAAGPSRKKHRIRKGQTLEKIAKIYNTSAIEIAKLNAIRNPRKIRAGQFLEIPGTVFQYR